MQVRKIKFMTGDGIIIFFTELDSPPESKLVESFQIWKNSLCEKRLGVLARNIKSW
uniref:Uncharacterized protein n=1 Tax=Arundo donax TaxID=35708 RepID=A0A0A9E8E7_ARUDO